MISAIAFCCAVAGAGSTTKPPAAAAVAARVIISRVIVLTRPFHGNQRARPASSSSYPLRQPDGHPAPGTDRRDQQRIAQGVRCASVTGAVAMLELVGTEIGDIGRELGVIIAKLLDLAAIMMVDFRFDRIGAGERGLFRHQGSRRAERE